MKLAALTLLAMTSAALAEDKVAADAAFRAAKELEKAGKLVEACPLYETSYRNDPQLGALLNLANCHELTGRTATAWVEYRDALELASRRGDPRVDYSTKRLAALEPRLSKLRIEAPAGVTVERNGTDVTALVRQDLAVDPGSYRVRVSAPGKVAWETSVAVQQEGHTTRVEVPELVAVAAVPASKPAPVIVVPPPVVATQPVTRVHAAPPSPRRAIAFAVGGAGLASSAVGLAFGLHARSQWSASRDNCDAHNVCNATGTTQIDSARGSATLATWTVGAGAAMLVTAAVIWWRAPSKRERVSVLPTIDPNGASVSAFARF